MRARARCCAQGEQWKKTTLKTALLYPGVVFAIFLTLNLLVRSHFCSQCFTHDLLRDG
jgi:hypothetical protein